MTAKLLTLTDLKRAVAKFGGTVESLDRVRHERQHNLDAPEGYVWSCDGIHCLACVLYPGHPDWTHEAVEDAIERVNCGIEKCTDPECDYCNDF